MVSVTPAVHHRNYQRARQRALVRLAQTFVEHYKQFLEEEKLKDVETGKKWIGIDPTTGHAITIESYKDAIEGSTDSDNEGANASDNGGKA